MKEAIVVKNLTRRFDELVAVDNISFSVDQGELFGFLGPNGAGKTTTINILATLLRPSSGQAFVAGYDVTQHSNEVRRNIGIVFQEIALDSKLTGQENLEFHAMMYGLAKQERLSRIQEVLHLVNLIEKRDVLVENYSGGMKRRLEIARGLIHRPRVLFLDEPTLGLDAQTRRHIWEYIQKLNKEEGVTIILTTHYMEEADNLCHRVAIMDQGKFVALDTPSRLKDILGGDVVTLELDPFFPEVKCKFEYLSWIKTVKRHKNSLVLTMEKAEKRIPELLRLAEVNGSRVTSVHLHKPSLEDVFLHFTGRRIREEEASLQERNRDRFRHHFRRR
jgi:ABC-2 type transport system ATP-binding protein